MATQPTTIDAALPAMCEKHGVFSLDIGINLRQRAEARFLCTAHHDGPTKFNGCVMAHGASVDEALRAMLVALTDDRGADQAVPAISMEMAA